MSYGPYFSRIIQRVLKLLTRTGYLIEEQGTTYLPEADRESALLPLQAASCTYRIALGPRAGQKVLSLQSVPSADKTPSRACVPNPRLQPSCGGALGADQRKYGDLRCQALLICLRQSAVLEDRHGPTPSRALPRSALSCHQPGESAAENLPGRWDYQRFETLLGEVVKRQSLTLYACVLMPNHFHLLLAVGRVPLSKAMQVLLYRYTRRYNQRYRKSGHLFQGRYTAILCDRDNYLWSSFATCT